mmetsp:Transcript_77575/g.240335  ORF Transcript_77575/g.240335 Transcript_77575/m.240335 type:complete len:581 (-) Transcript_77575:1047-2789(-)
MHPAVHRLVIVHVLPGLLHHRCVVGGFEELVHEYDVRTCLGDQNRNLRSDLVRMHLDAGGRDGGFFGVLVPALEASGVHLRVWQVHDGAVALRVHDAHHGAGKAKAVLVVELQAERVFLQRGLALGAAVQRKEGLRAVAAGEGVARGAWAGRTALVEGRHAGRHAPTRKGGGPEQRRHHAWNHIARRHDVLESLGHLELDIWLPILELTKSECGGPNGEVLHAVADELARLGAHGVQVLEVGPNLHVGEAHNGDDKEDEGDRRDHAPAHDRAKDWPEGALVDLPGRRLAPRPVVGVGLEAAETEVPAAGGAAHEVQVHEPRKGAHHGDVGHDGADHARGARVVDGGQVGDGVEREEDPKVHRGGHCDGHAHGPHRLHETPFGRKGGVRVVQGEDQHVHVVTEDPNHDKRHGVGHRKVPLDTEERQHAYARHHGEDHQHCAHKRQQTARLVQGAGEPEEEGGREEDHHHEEHHSLGRSSHGHFLQQCLGRAARPGIVAPGRKFNLAVVRIVPPRREDLLGLLLELSQHLLCLRFGDGQGASNTVLHRVARLQALDNLVGPEEEEDGLQALHVRQNGLRWSA